MSPSDESNYKRMEDQKWREQTNDRLASLTASEVVQNDRLDEQHEEILTIRTILEGDPKDKHDNGMKGDLHELSISINQLRAIMAPDSLMQGGVIARLKALEKKAGLEERESDNRWKFRTAIAVAIVSLIGLTLTNLDRIESSLRKVFAHVEESTLQKKPGAKTNKKRRHRRPAVSEAPTEATDDGAAKEDVSE